MPKFRIPVTRITQGHVLIEADSVEEAMDAVIDLNPEEYKKAFVKDKKAAEDFVDALMCIEDVIKYNEK